MHRTITKPPASKSCGVTVIVSAKWSDSFNRLQGRPAGRPCFVHGLYAMVHQRGRIDDGCRSFGTRVKSEPGGFKAISRWLSPRQRAIPPGYERDNDITPEGCRQWGCDPSGVGSFPSAFRGCRPTASPPANGWHPSGMMKPCSRWDSSICSSRGNPRWSAIRSPFGALFQKICTQLLSLKYSISAVGHAELPPTIKTPQPSEGFTYNRSLAIIVLSASACKERARHGSATGPK